MLKFNSKYWIFIALTSILLVSSCKSSKKSSSTKKTKKTESSTTKPPSSSSSHEEQVVKLAKSYIGTPYRTGGTTRAGMDCSGLMFTTFQTINKELPRTSVAQSTLGQKVGIDDMKEGDLVFFTDRKGSKKVTHVGMVTQVKGSNDIKFIHASTKLGVVESDLYAPYYISIFLFAKRIF
jgi:cell wall-associated NlpC family hydrolase